ncbi:hypothetical protein [Acidisphaera sp. L21]|uniref:hypothetical protein n=1 Tax=Acidisphaera sp. L21 TaxID=1641851 RepID=UPI00131B2A49|nr:hypothetical protein [Acidisphaera sp. L21]
MHALSLSAPIRGRDAAPQPFRSAEEAWLWTMAALMARRDGAGVSWRPEGPQRPCDPDDILRSLDTLYRQRSIELLHVRILRIWGERQSRPHANRPGQLSDWRLWHQALGQLEWTLRARGIVR